MFESQPLRPLCELHAPGLALLQNPVTEVTGETNGFSIHTLMLAVMAAEAARKFKVTIVRVIGIPPDFHQREDIPGVSAL